MSIMEGNQTAFETEFRKYFETAVSIVLIFECIIGIIFNVATVHVILSFSKLQTPSNQLLLSLSLGDLCACCTAPAVIAKLYFKHINDHNSWEIACFTFQGKSNMLTLTCCETHEERVTGSMIDMPQLS